MSNPTFPGGEVLLTRAASSEDNYPVLSQFLGFLARDIASHPQRAKVIDACLVHRLRALSGNIEIDLDASLSADDE